MTNDRSTRTFVAAFLLLAAVLVGMNRAVTSAPLGDWWLPVLLAIAGIAVALYRAPARTETLSGEEVARPPVREYLPPATPAEPLPASPETASLSASTISEATPASPETAAPPPPSHVAKTEHAAPEQITAAEAPPAPPPDDSKSASPKTQPETQVVMEAMADAPQPYETEATGQVTPEIVKKVAEGKGEETPVAAKTTKKASRKVAAQETTGAVTPGKPDDLLRIDGIGPKGAAALQAAGIDSFQKLANTSEDKIRDTLRAAKLRVPANYTTWAQQAAYAARGDWEGFDRFNSEHKPEGG